MGLRKTYREDVERLESRVEKNFSRNRFRLFKRILDAALPFVFLLLFFMVVFSFFIPPGSHSVWIDRLNWLMIGYFFARLVVGYRLSRSRARFFQEHWLDILLVIPAFTIFRAAKLGRLAPLVGRLPLVELGSSFGAAGEAAKMTRITRIIKRSL